MLKVQKSKNSKGTFCKMRTWLVIKGSGANRHFTVICPGGGAVYWFESLNISRIK